MKYYIDFYRHAFDFKGRTSRRGYWTFFLYDFFVRVILILLGVAVHALLILYSLYSLILIIPTFSLTTRRLHDVGQSGWLQIVPALIGVAGLFAAKTLDSASAGIIAIILLVLCLFYLLYLTCKKGDIQDNGYGPLPALM